MTIFINKDSGFLTSFHDISVLSEIARKNITLPRMKTGVLCFFFFGLLDRFPINDTVFKVGNGFEIIFYYERQ